MKARLNKAPPTAQPWSTSQIREAIARRYAQPEHCLLEEVRNAAGFESERSADAVAMSVWPSRGLELHGIEIKASRSDWTRELKKPQKQEAIFQYMDRFWLAVGSRELVREGELPTTWGLLVPRGDKLVAEVEAPKLTPKPVSRGFLASILRNALRSSPNERAVKEAREAGYRDGKRHGDEDDARLAKQVEKFEQALGLKLAAVSIIARDPTELGRALKMVLDGGHVDLEWRVAEFEKASGLKIDTWTYGNMGETVRALMRSGGMAGVRGRLENILREAEHLGSHVKRVLQETGAMLEDDDPQETVDRPAGAGGGPPSGGVV